jgi:hypothetical protein
MLLPQPLNGSDWVAHKARRIRGQHEFRAHSYPLPVTGTAPGAVSATPLNSLPRGHDPTEVGTPSWPVFHGGRTPPLRDSHI